MIMGKYSFSFLVLTEANGKRRSVGKMVPEIQPAHPRDGSVTILTHWLTVLMLYRQKRAMSRAIYLKAKWADFLTPIKSALLITLKSFECQASEYHNVYFPRKQDQSLIHHYFPSVPFIEIWRTSTCAWVRTNMLSIMKRDELILFSVGFVLILQGKSQDTGCLSDVGDDYYFL